MSAAAGLARLAGPGHAGAAAARAGIARLALEARNEAGSGAFASVGDYLAELSGRTVCLTLLAGSGTRWVKSLAAGRERGDPAALGFDPAAPRGLFPVRDFLGVSRRPDGLVAIAAYALAALRGLGGRILVVRGWEEEIDREVLAPLGIAAGERSYVTQAAPFGKPLGHGDAAWQCRGLLAGADYVVVNFGGDASSALTASSSLLALDALNASGARTDLLMPAAFLPAPAYPIGLDAAGLPRSFGHAKLSGAAVTGGPGYANVGVRLYRAPALLELLESMHSRYWVEGQGYAVPGNDPAGREFALDNVDAELAAAGRARILALARSDELTPAKSLDEVPAFEAAVERVVAGDRV